MKRGVVKKFLKSKRVNKSNNTNLIMYNFGSGKKVKLINYKSRTIVPLGNRGNNCEMNCLVIVTLIVAK